MTPRRVKRQHGLFGIIREAKGFCERYGGSGFGQGCLPDRRLVVAGVRAVDVHFDGWDTRRKNFERVPARAGTLDRALAPLADLRNHVLLDTALAAVVTEFGRTPAPRTATAGAITRRRTANSSAAAEAAAATPTGRPTGFPWL